MTVFSFCFRLLDIVLVPVQLQTASSVFHQQEEKTG